jgi:hypothetical protein
MKVVLLIAGIGFLLAGLVGVVAGIPVKEFSFGNTLIVTGAVLTSTGMILLGLWTVVRELSNIAQQLGNDRPANDRPTSALDAAAGNQVREEGDFLFSRDQPAIENADHVEPVAEAPSPAPWQEKARSRERARSEAPAAPEPVEASPAAKRRNLMFSSSRKERERAQARIADPSVTDDLPTAPVAAPPSFEANEMPAATFAGAWPKAERPRAPEAPLPRRSGRAPSAFTEATSDAARDERHPQNEGPPPVTVLKSGVVDGMAYSLYSDGSIEAQMPEGMMRFASIDELRAYLDQRP